MPSQSPTNRPSGATEIVWQWLTYGLWQGVLLILSFFLSSVFAYYFVHGNTSLGQEFSVYSLAAIICVTPLAFLVDRAYSKQEPAEKYGFASVVLVLNAVFVAVVLVGSLVALVVSVFWMILNAEMSSATTVSILTSLVVTALGLLLFTRIVGAPHRLKRILKLFPLIVVGVVALTSILSIAGPVRSFVSTRADRLIEDNITTLNSAIQTYATDHSRLPKSLDELSLTESSQSGAKKLVSRKVVTYKPDDTSTDSYSLTYKLCVTFKKSKGTQEGGSFNSLYAVTYSHGSGEQCYDQSAYGSSLDLNNSTPTDYNTNYDDFLQNLQTDSL